MNRLQEGLVTIWNALFFCIIQEDIFIAWQLKDKNCIGKITFLTELWNYQLILSYLAQDGQANSVTTEFFWSRDAHRKSIAVHGFAFSFWVDLQLGTCFSRGWDLLLSGGPSNPCTSVILSFSGTWTIWFLKCILWLMLQWLINACSPFQTC